MNKGIEGHFDGQREREDTKGRYIDNERVKGRMQGHNERKRQENKNTEVDRNNIEKKRERKVRKRNIMIDIQKESGRKVRKRNILIDTDKKK